MRASRLARVLLLSALAVGVAGVASATTFTGWEPASKIDTVDGNSSELNTTFLDGCPIQSPDGLTLYMASNRPRFVGDTRTDLDIWVASRGSTSAPWSAPTNLGEPVNSLADDFCPTPVRGNGLFFVSREALPASCGMADIYFARRNAVHGWGEPVNLGCNASGGPNTALDEQGPSYFEAGGRAFLYFSSGPDIYASEQRADGGFRVGQAVTSLNGAAADIQPNVRKDGREIVFASNRAGTQDIYSASRESVADPWSAPILLGSEVNTAAANETRPSFSWDARQLLFGRAPGPEGSSDIYLTTREAR
jgi:WD40-like Beta Propeller Repeat